MMDYYHFQGEANYGLFVLTLTGAMMIWYKTLLDRNIDLYKDLYEAFTSKFTTQK